MFVRETSTLLWHHASCFAHNQPWYQHFKSDALIFLFELTITEAVMTIVEKEKPL